MSPFPRFGPPPGILAEEEVIIATLWAVTDDAVGGWENESGQASNPPTVVLAESVDSESDADYVTLSIPVVTSGTSSLRFIQDIPSQDPSSKQTVFAQVRCEWIDVLGAANPDAGDPSLTIRIKEGATTVRSSQVHSPITTTPTDYTAFMTEAEINSVTDWSDIRVEMEFDVAGIDTDEEVNYRVYEVRIEFQE